MRNLTGRIAASTTARRLAVGTWWNMVGTVAARCLSLVASIVAARVLGTTAFGEFGIIQSTVGMAGIFAGLGLGVTATKYLAEFRLKDRERAGRLLALSLCSAVVSGGLMSLLFAAAAPLLAESMLAAQHLTGLLQVGSLLLFVNAVNGAQLGALAGFEAFRAVARVNLFSALATILFQTCGILAAGVKGGVFGLLAAGAVSWSIAHFELRKSAGDSGIQWTFSGWNREIATLWNFSLPSLLASALYGPVSWFCNTLLVRQPDGYAQMGIFNATNQWFAMIMFIPGLVSQVLLPIMSEAAGEENRERSRRILSVSVRCNALVVVPMIVVTCLASPWIMAAYGSQFSDSWPTLTVVIATAGILAVQSPVGQAIIAEGKVWSVFALNLAWAAVLIAAALLLVGRGAFGLAMARMIAYAVQTFWIVGYVQLFLHSRSEVAANRI